MKKIILYTLLLTATSAVAQNRDNNRAVVLHEIEKNNTTLIALRQQMETDKASNKVGNALPDPTFGFSYSWGNKEGMEGKKTFNAEQELDLGTLSGQRSKTAKSNNQIVELNYQIERQAILAEAELLLVQLTYQNAMCDELSARLERAALLQQVYKKKMETGDANQMEINKTNLFHLSALTAYKKQQAERDMILDNLKRINGDQEIIYNYTQYGNVTLEPLAILLDKAKEIAPQIQIANAAILKEKAELKLNKIEAMPELSVGYTGEHVGGENYNGVSIGVSIPLWSNSRNKVRQQKSAILTAKMKKADVETQTLSTIKLQYANAMNLFNIAKEYQRQTERNNEDLLLLRKALDAGQISLIEYLNEITFYDEAQNQALEAERDSQIITAEMYSIFR